MGGIRVEVVPSSLLLVLKDVVSELLLHRLRSGVQLPTALLSVMLLAV